MAVTSEGDRVAETDVVGEEPKTRSRRRERAGHSCSGCTRISISPRLGFACTTGYTRLHADSPGVGEPLPVLATDDYAQTVDRAYRGLWGHKQVAADAAPPDNAIVIGLYDEGPIGLCRVFVSERLVDGPGLRAGARAPHNYLRLLSGACALLGPGPIDLDSWETPKRHSRATPTSASLRSSGSADGNSGSTGIERTRRAWADHPADRRLVLRRHSGTLAQSREGHPSSVVWCEDERWRWRRSETGGRSGWPSVGSVVIRRPASE